MATATTTIDDRDFQQAIRRLTLLNKKELPVMVRQSARRVAVNLSRYTLPFGFEESGKRLFEQAVKNDYARTTSVSSIEMIDFIMDVTGKTRNIRQSLRRKDGTPYLVEWDEITTSPGRVKRHHKSRRSPVTGRVSRAGENTRDIGRWKANNKTVTTAEVKERAMVNALKRVGLAKYGWAMCARQLGGTRGIPSWVKRGRGISKPAATVQETMTQGGIHIAMTNNVPYVSRLLSQSNTMRALNRERDFLRQEIQRRVKQKW